MVPTKEQIRDRLAAIKAPDGRPLPNSGTLSEIVVGDDGKVFFSIAVDAAAVKAWAGSEGIACLDLLPAFDAAMRLGREPSYFAFDSHWNAAGQQIAADATVQYLKENLP